MEVEEAQGYAEVQEAHKVRNNGNRYMRTIEQVKETFKRGEVWKFEK